LNRIINENKSCTTTATLIVFPGPTYDCVPESKEMNVIMGDIKI
jgi:hypothetical protein